MSRNSTRLLLSIASLVMLGYSQNAATNSNDLLPDEDGGQVRVVRADSGASTVSGKETAAIRAPKQVTMFFGGTWAEESNRVREGQLTNLLTSAGSAKQQEMSKSGLRAVDSRNSFTEDFTDMRLHPPLTDLGIQRQIQTWISTGAMQAPQANSVYVIYLGRECGQCCGIKSAGRITWAITAWCILTWELLCMRLCLMTRTRRACSRRRRGC